MIDQFAEAYPWLFVLCMFLAALFPAAIFGYALERFLKRKYDLETFQSGIVRKTNFED